MKIKNLTLQEIEAMSYDDIAFMILSETGKKMKVLDLFRKVVKALQKDEKLVEDKIADFFELISTDKKFVMLEKGYVDLRDKHSNRIVIDNGEEVDSEDIESTEELEELEELEEEEEEIFVDEEEDIDDEDDELKDLVVLDDEEEVEADI